MRSPVPGRTPILTGMHEFGLPLPLSLPPDTRRDLDDLADATGRLPEDLAREAVRRHLDDEARRVRSAGQRLASAHAGLLQRLGE